MLWAEILLSSSSSTFLTINSVSDWVRTLWGRSLCFALLLPGKESRSYVLLEGLAHAHSSVCLGCSSSYSKIKTNLDQGRTHTTCAPWTFGGEHEGKLWCSTKSAELFLLKQFTCPKIYGFCVLSWDRSYSLTCQDVSPWCPRGGRRPLWVLFRGLWTRSHEDQQGDEVAFQCWLICILSFSLLGLTGRKPSTKTLFSTTPLSPCWTIQTEEEQRNQHKDWTQLVDVVVTFWKFNWLLLYLCWIVIATTIVKG